MADKAYTRLSNVTLSAFRTQLTADPVFNSLTEAQQNACINEAQDKLNALLIDNGFNYYGFDCIADADAVLAPVAAGNESRFDDYLEVTLDAYDGTADVVGENAATAVGGMTLGAVTADDAGSDYIIYTIPITGATFDGRMVVEPSFPNDLSFEKVDSTTIKAYAAKSHGAMSFYLKKPKVT